MRTRPAAPLRLLAIGPVLLLVVGLVAGCGGGAAKKSDGKTPAQRLASAQQAVADAKGLTLSLSTAAIPKGHDGILTADGIGTSAPAFEGTITAVLNGLSGKVPVTAVDGKVYISLFGGPYKAIDPASLGAPDPATLFGPDGGLATLLTGVKHVEKGDDTRVGKKVYSTVTGTIDGSRVTKIFPSAGTGDFDATFTLDDSDHVTKAVVTGPFFKGEKNVTYSIGLSRYGATQDIKKP